MTTRGIVRAMHPRILAGLSLALSLSFAGAHTAPDAALEALLAARPASDTQAVRETLLQGDTSVFAADLLARAHAGDARRWVLVELVAGPVLMLLVDDGERPHVYRRSVSWRASMGHDNEKLVREVAPAQADRLWRAWQQHGVPAAPAASAAEGDGQEVILGIARMHDARGDRWRLLRRSDMASWHPSTAAADLLCSTLLAGLHCKPGMQQQADEWFGEWMQTVSTLKPSASEQRDDALWTAVRAGDWTRAKALVDAGADPNAFASDGDSLAHWLAARRDPDAAAHLASLGADPQAPTFFGDKPDVLAH